MGFVFFFNIIFIGKHVLIQGNGFHLSGISTFCPGFPGTERIVCSSVAAGRTWAFDGRDKLFKYACEKQT